jgi:hypothetical protein
LVEAEVEERCLDAMLYVCQRDSFGKNFWGRIALQGWRFIPENSSGPHVSDADQKTTHFDSRLRLALYE